MTMSSWSFSKLLRGTGSRPVRTSHLGSPPVQPEGRAGPAMLAPVTTLVLLTVPYDHRRDLKPGHNILLSSHR